MTKGLQTVLSVENIRLKAKHGWYAEERSMGGMYIINVHFAHQSPPFEGFDDLDSTINYEIIYDKVLMVMDQEHKLIEHCAKAIFDELKHLSDHGQWTVELIKENPPIRHVGATKFKIVG